ncbi:unnamed protein product [marine sediment metagenome]|uniref:Uncharacterized protein n=1 Tax=marine sediment metagenome TaxID=412755 RepID=X0VNG2_9ZZZZ
MENIMPEAQMPIGAPPQAGTTPAATNPPAKNVKRKRGRPKKIMPEFGPEPATETTATIDGRDEGAIWKEEVSKGLQAICARLTALEEKNKAAEVAQAQDEEAARLAKLTNLERAEERSRLHKAAQEALAAAKK